MKIDLSGNVLKWYMRIAVIVFFIPCLILAIIFKIIEAIRMTIDDTIAIWNQWK